VQLSPILVHISNISAYHTSVATGVVLACIADQEAKLALNSTVKPLPIPESDFKP